MLSTITLPWIDSEDAVNGNERGEARLGEWLVVSGPADWSPCGAVLPIEERASEWSSEDAVCICRPMHEHPHIATNRWWVKAHPDQRTVSVSKAKVLDLQGDGFLPEIP